jgi:hypothetical protein
LWDGGIDVWLGKEVNGYVVEETGSAASEIAPWLQEAIAHFYPTSTYAASLSPEVRERAAARQFLPPRIAARVNCPHCGIPNVVTEMEEVFAFVCSQCGNSVKVDHPRFSEPRHADRAESLSGARKGPLDAERASGRKNRVEGCSDERLIEQNAETVGPAPGEAGAGLPQSLLDHAPPSDGRRKSREMKMSACPDPLVT